LALVNTDPRNLVYETKPSDAGYAFPDPGLFVGVATEKTQARYFENWLRHRKEVIFRFVSARSPARPLSNQMWRSLLVFGGSTASDGSATKTAERRKFISQLFGNVVDEDDGVQIAESNPSSSDIFWQEQQLPSGLIPTQRIGQEILWELYELNFRFELLALDRRASGTAENDDVRQDDILACISTPGCSSLLVADVKYANQGLAAESWVERLPYLLALQKLMRTWTGSPSSLRHHVVKPYE
jgi:hypothetical protein